MQKAIEEAKKMIKEEEDSKNILMDREDRLHYSIRIGCLQELIERLEAKVSLPQEPTLELSLIEKAKEEERKRIVGILEERYDIEWVGLGIPISIEEAITRITS